MYFQTLSDITTNIFIYLFFLKGNIFQTKTTSNTKASITLTRRLRQMDPKETLQEGTKELDIRHKNLVLLTDSDLLWVETRSRK